MKSNPTESNSGLSKYQLNNTNEEPYINESMPDKKQQIASDFSRINIQNSSSKLSTVQFNNLKCVPEVKEDHSHEGEDDSSSEVPNKGRPRASTFYNAVRSTRPLIQVNEPDQVAVLEESKTKPHGD